MITYLFALNYSTKQIWLVSNVKLSLLKVLSYQKYTIYSTLYSVFDVLWNTVLPTLKAPLKKNHCVNLVWIISRWDTPEGLHQNNSENNFVCSFNFCIS